MPEHASRFSTGLYDQQNEDRVADWGGDDLFTRMPRPRAVDDAPAPRFRPSLALVDPPEDRRRAPAPSERDGARDRRRSMTAEVAMRERAERLGLTVMDSAAPTRAGDDASAARARGGDDAPPARAGVDDDVSASREVLADGSTAHDGSAARDGAPDHAGSAPWDAAAWHAATRAGADPNEGGWHPTVRQWDGSSELPERAANGRRTTLITGHPDGLPRPLPFEPAERRRPQRTPAEWVGPRPERIMAWAFVLGLVLIMIAISTADAATL